MISNKYQKEIWYKFIQEKYPKIANELDMACDNIEVSPSNACNSLRNIIDKLIHQIGLNLNEKELMVPTKELKNKHKSLNKKIASLKNLNVIDNDTYKNLSRARQYLNYGVHDYEEMYLEFVPSLFIETTIFIKWFIKTFEDLDAFETELLNKNIDDETNGESDKSTDENTIVKKIKFCSNKKQCGRSFDDSYEPSFCISCAAPIEEIEEIIEINKEVDEEVDEDTSNNGITDDSGENDNNNNHYIAIGSIIRIGDDEEVIVHTQIQLDENEIIIGRASERSNFTPDVDIAKYLEDKYKYMISKKHISIYKENDKYYLKNISNGNYVYYDVIEDGELYEDPLDNSETLELINGRYVKLNNVAFVQYISNI